MLSTLLILVALVGVSHAWVNNWNGYLRYQCSGNSVMRGWQGVHSNYYEDRLFNFHCTSTNTITARSYSGYVNWFDYSIYYRCSSGYSLSYARSYHHNYYQDRRWQFGCARHTNYAGSYHTGCYWTGYINWWDSYFNYYAPSGYTLAGVRSYHSNYREDRRWSFYICRVQCSSGYYRSGTRCVCPYSYYLYGYLCYAYRSCTYGQRSSSSYYNRNCYSCQRGKYQNKASHTDTTCSSCSAGTYQDQYGQRTCKTCPSSTYQPYSGQTYCRSCSRGYYRSASYRQTRCQPGYRCPGSCSRQSCTPGTYQDQYGQTTCKTCPYGSYYGGYRATRCTGCPAGYYTVSYSSSPVRCPPGYYCSGCRRYRCSGERYSDQYGQTSCKTARRCGAGQYAYRSPSYSTDRVCTTCPSNRYQPSSSHTLTYCYTVRNCPIGQYVAANPTTSTNRVCATCPSGTFSTTINARSCISYASCGVGQYAYFTSTTTGVLCRTCPSGTYQDSTSHRSTSCKSWSAVCARGTYQSISPTSGRDRTCTSCPPNTYSDSQGATTCRNHRVCNVGETQQTAPSSSTDRSCRSCNGATEYQDQTGSTSCKSITSCSSGQYETRAPTRSSNRLCATCRTSCPSGQALVGSCSGTNNPTCQPCHSSCGTCTGTGENQCVTCANSVLSLTTDNRCINADCADDEYRNAQGVCTACHSTCATCEGGAATQCLTCTGSRYLQGTTCVTTCPSGYYKRAQTDDNQCTRCSTCATGKYAPTSACDGSFTHDVSCTDWRMCGIGQKETTVPTHTSDRVCGSCSVGTEYQNEPGKRFCKEVTVCGHGTSIASQPTASTDRTCSNCAPGSFTNDDNLDNCIPCAPGTSESMSGSPSCDDCGLGSYQTQPGQSSCDQIPPGSYGTGGTPSTRTNIATCPAGFFCTGGAHDKRPCPPNQYQSQTGQTSCNDVTVCGDGEYVMREPTSVSDRVCNTCPDGTYQDDDDHEEEECIAWTTCPRGSFISTSGNARRDQACTSCPTNTYQDQTNQVSCKAVTACPAGQAELTGPTPSADRTCEACVSGVDFTDDSGATDCEDVTRCALGTYQTAAPTVTSDRQCSNCPGGKYTDMENQLSCKSHTLCDAGEQELNAPTSSGDRECGPCAEGHYYPTGMHSADDCRVIDTCEAGQYVKADGTPTSDRDCENCQLGSTFSTTENAIACGYVANCTRGERQSTAPSISTDRVCSSCPSGTYQDALVHSFPSCKTIANCDRGSFILYEATNSTNRICEKCNGITQYQSRANQNSCRNVTMCTDQQYEITPPGDDHDRICRACTLASACTTNEYLFGTCGGDDGTVNTRCAPCHPTCAGCTGPNANQCTGCAAHLHFDDGVCLSDCIDGEYSNNGVCSECHSSCADCDGPEATDCVLCSGDLSLDERTGACVTECSGSYYAEDNLCKLCSACPHGFYASTACSATADTVCTAWSECMPGQEEAMFPTATRDRTCVNCRLGYEYQPLADQRSCSLATVCVEPEIEIVAPTLTTDRSCACDTQTCSQIINDLYEREVCAEPTDDQLANALEWCCLGLSEDAIVSNIRNTEEYMARHTCEGCTDSCDCAAGFYIEYDADSADCLACDGIDNYGPRAGLTDCLDVDVCQRGQFVVASPTTTTNRVCEDCPAGTVDHDLNGHNECLECDPGVYTPTASVGMCSTYRCHAGTVDADRNATTPCEPCTFGATYQDLPGQTECKDVTVCAPGEEEVRPMTLISDRVCDECPEGTFKSESGQGLACQRVQSCLEGYEQTAAPTSTSDRVCTPCMEGTWKELAGHNTECIPVTTCGAGEEEVRAPSRAHDRVCRSCLLHITYRPSDMETCVPVTRCRGDEYISTPATLTSDVTCSEHTDCPDYAFQSQAPSFTSDRVCSNCTDCPSGRFEYRPCSALEDTQCEGCADCPPDQYIIGHCTMESDVQCRDCSVCEDFEYKVDDCTRDVDTICRSARVCQQNEYEIYPATATSDRLCRPLTVCDDTEYELDAPTATTDRECRFVTVCDPGEETFEPATYNSDATCRPCPAGSTDTDGDGATRCDPCGQGHFVPRGSIGPCIQYECPAGSADDDRMAASPCEQCVEGETYQPMRAALSCLPVSDCPLGYEEVVMPTLYTNRQCARCTLGLTFRGEDQDQCTLVSGCGNEEFAIAQPTISSDRVCQEATQCGNGTYTEIPLTATSDRACADWAVCGPNEFESVPPSAVNNRACRTITECTDTQYENRPPTASSNRLCSPISPCPEGYFELMAPTQTSDRVCAIGYSVDIVFDLPYFRTIGTTEDKIAFDEELRASINKTLDVSKVLTINYKQGSIIATVISFDEGFIADVFNATVSGLIVVRGVGPAVCETYQFLDDPDPNPFVPPNCVDFQECGLNRYESVAPTSTSDRQCDDITICGLNGNTDEYLVTPATATTDNICATRPPPPSTAAARAAPVLSAGLTVVVALFAALILIVALVFIIWRQRKVSKDRRQNEAIEKWATSHTGLADELSEGNTLLRQLSMRDKGAVLFDNPVFGSPTSNARPDWFVGPMTRQGAQDLLNGRGQIIGDFVVRESSSNGAFVLSVRVDAESFEHYKLSKDDNGNFLVDNKPLSTTIRTLDQLVDHLTRYTDNTSVLLYLEEEYGQVTLKKGASMNLGSMGSSAVITNAIPEGDFYGSLMPSQADSYGSILRDQRPQWHKGKLARGEAEALLANDRTPGNFLVRESKAREGTFAISLVIPDGRVEHHSLAMKNGSFYLNDHPMSLECTTLEEVVRHLASYKEDLAHTLNLPGDDSMASIPGMGGFSNPSMIPTAKSAGDMSGYDNLANANAPRGVVANPGYDDLGPNSDSFDATFESNTDDAPPPIVRAPKPAHLLGDDGPPVQYHDLPPKPQTDA